jgi:hypothetical protein
VVRGIVSSREGVGRERERERGIKRIERKRGERNVEEVQLQVERMGGQWREGRSVWLADRREEEEEEEEDGDQRGRDASSRSITNSGKS